MALDEGDQFYMWKSRVTVVSLPSKRLDDVYIHCLELLF